MSTKTTFKRVALVAVAALGFGLLSTVPSQAATSGLTVSATTGATSTLIAGTTIGGVSDTTTAALITVTALFDDGGDSITVSAVSKSVPDGSSRVMLLGFYDTSTASGYAKTYVSDSAVGVNVLAKNSFDSETVASAVYSQKIVSGASGYTSARYFMQLESGTGTTIAGAYTYTVIVKTYSKTGLVATTTQDVTVTVATPAAESLVASSVYSTSTDPATSVLATVSATDAAKTSFTVTLKNASNNTAARESVTATITGPGTVGVAGGGRGKSVVLPYTGAMTISVWSDGTAGTSTINVSTPSVTFQPKTVTFYSAAAKTITASVYTPVLKVGTNANAVKVVAVDSLGNPWTGTAYIYASTAADALIGGSNATPVQCGAYNTTDKAIYCPVDTLAVGTAKFKVIDASTVALATATSNEVTVTVSADTAATVKLAFNKASYQPGEKAYITVTPVSSAGAKLAANTWATLFTSAGITSDVAFSAGGATATDLATASITTADYDYVDQFAGAKTYVVYMPYASGTVTISATGGASLPTAGQVKVTASATVVNSSVDAATDAANEATDAANAATDAANAAAEAADAATAAAQDASDAVAALAQQVNDLISALKAQITSLTNIVIKIQKKLKIK